MSSSDDSSYGLEPIPEVPDLPGSVRMGEDTEAALDMLAADLFVQSSNCVSSFGHFHLALSHGRAQERIIMKLMTDPKYRSIPWDRTHVWSVAERIVEPGHPDHSMTHWRELIAEPGDVPGEQLHAIQAHRPNGDEVYERELVSHLEWRERGHDRLDYVILGSEIELLGGYEDPMGRLMGRCDDLEQITMTKRLLNASRTVAVIGIGQDGRDLIDAVREDHTQVGVSPDAGSLKWFLDAYACRCTEEEPH